jgi:hypothetical protein
MIRFTRTCSDRLGEVRLPYQMYRQLLNELRAISHATSYWKLAEYRVAELCGGQVYKAYASKSDVLTPLGQTIQVKSSQCRRRWCFSNADTSCNHLILTAKKDPDFIDQYPDDADFVYWLIPQSDVKLMVSSHSGYIQISTDPSVASYKRFAPYMAPEARIARIDDLVRSSSSPSQ